jgi:hypothetical protein
MGLRNEAAVGAKASGKAWISGTEQIRMSYVLKRIISGELVCIPGKPGRAKGGGYQPGNAVLADHPVPLRQPLKMVFYFKLGRLRMVPVREPPGQSLPSFKTELNNPPKWKCLERADERDAYLRV